MAPMKCSWAEPYPTTGAVTCHDSNPVPHSDPQSTKVTAPSEDPLLQPADVQTTKNRVVPTRAAAKSTKVFKPLVA
eukprot:6472008-Amphidinium_carterae.2